VSDQSDGGAVSDFDVDLIEDFDIWLAGVAKSNVSHVNLSDFRLSLSFSHFLGLIVAFLSCRLGHETCNFIESTLHLRNLLQILVQTQDVPYDLPVVQQVGSYFTRSELAILDGLATEECNPDECTIEEPLEAEHHRCVVLGHVRANVVHAFVAVVEEIGADLLTRESFHCPYVTKGFTGNSRLLSLDFLVLLLGELCQTRPSWHN